MAAFRHSAIRDLDVWGGVESGMAASEPESHLHPPLLAAFMHSHGDLRESIGEMQR
jgi:hypothetical protein